MSSASAFPAASRYGEVFDRGYAHYEGRRQGRFAAWWSLTTYSMKRALGLRKRWTAKVLPFCLYVSALVPVVVLVAIAALLPAANLGGYPRYFDGIALVTWVFIATVAPEMLCVDRRENTLPFYFSRAITRFDYVLAKLTATVLLTMTLTVIPVSLLWLGWQLVADSPGQAMRAHLDDLGKVVLVGAMLAVVGGVAGLVVSAITDRKAVAVAIIIAGELTLTAIAHFSFVALHAGWRRYFIFISANNIFSAVTSHLFPATRNEGTLMEIQSSFSPQVYLLYLLALTVIGVLFIRWRYSPRD
jgi:ABC-2 type transport system permease protein